MEARHGFYEYEGGSMHFHPTEYNMQVIVQQLSNYVKMLENQTKKTVLRAEAIPHVPKPAHDENCSSTNGAHLETTSPNDEKMNEWKRSERTKNINRRNAKVAPTDGGNQYHFNETDRFETLSEDSEEEEENELGTACEINNRNEFKDFCEQQLKKIKSDFNKRNSSRLNKQH